MAASGDLVAAKLYFEVHKMFPYLEAAVNVAPSLILRFVSAKKKDDDQTPSDPELNGEPAP
jgi:hypothetical protein